VYSFETDLGAVLLNSWALASFDWILAHPEAGIRLSSNSWGTMGPDDYDPANPINVTTRTMYDRRVTVIFADLRRGELGRREHAEPVREVAVGVSVAAGDKSGKLGSFSSRGRMDDGWDRRKAQRSNGGIYRATITAPGVSIVAAKSAQATLMATGTDPANPCYTTASGTSMAAPHVAGVAALMLEARPGLRPQHVIDVLEGTATNMPSYELFETGMGYLDAHAAVVAAEKGKVNLPSSVSGKTPTFTLASGTTFTGSVDTPNTWAIAACGDSLGLLDHHLFDVPAGTGAMYAEIEWPSISALGETVTTDLLYLRIHAPDCTVVGESAALLDFGTVWFRSLIVTNPAPGTYTAGVYGLINKPTSYWARSTRASRADPRRAALSSVRGRSREGTASIVLGRVPDPRAAPPRPARRVRRSGRRGIARVHGRARPGRDGGEHRRRERASSGAREVRRDGRRARRPLVRARADPRDGGHEGHLEASGRTGARRRVRKRPFPLTHARTWRHVFVHVRRGAGDVSLLLRAAPRRRDDRRRHGGAAPLGGYGFGSHFFAKTRSGWYAPTR